MNELPSTWDHYRSFLTVVREGSLSAAARQLGLTQPTLARHIEQLEKALGGVDLFIRSPQGLSPTDLGRKLITHAEAMEAAAAAFQRSAVGTETELSGIIRISASDVVGTELLPAYLKDIRWQHPGLKFEVTLSNRITDLLKRQADIAIRMTRPTQKALIARRAPDIHLGLFAHEDYLATHGTPRRLEDLPSHTLIGFDRDTASAALMKTTGLPFGRDDFSFFIDNQVAQLAAIRQACGIGFCQVGLGERTKGLIRLFADSFSLSMEVWITMHEDLKTDQRMRLVFDALYDAFKRDALRQDR